MKKYVLIAMGAALLGAAPLTVQAQGGPPKGAPGDPHHQANPTPPGHGQGMDHPGAQHRSQDNQRYGRWDDAWGSPPPPPPKHFGRHGAWYGHVRACQMRYRSYNPRTDFYIARPGVKARCRL